MADGVAGVPISGSPRAVQRPGRAGEAVVASFGSYGDAQAALDVLAERDAPIEAVRIVARDLIFVERVVLGAVVGVAGSWGAGRRGGLRPARQP
jgi:hypothetical protein